MVKILISVLLTSSTIAVTVSAAYAYSYLISAQTGSVPLNGFSSDVVQPTCDPPSKIHVSVDEFDYHHLVAIANRRQEIHNVKIQLDLGVTFLAREATVIGYEHGRVTGYDFGVALRVSGWQTVVFGNYRCQQP